MQIKFFVTDDGLKYKRTIEDGKTWWAVQHDQGWTVLSGVPSLEVHPLIPTGDSPPVQLPEQLTLQLQ